MEVASWNVPIGLVLRRTSLNLRSIALVALTDFLIFKSLYRQQVSM